MWTAVALLLLWVFAVVVVVSIVNTAQNRLPGTGLTQILVGPKCPTCGARFVPDKKSWEPTSKCLDGLDYCAACKVKGTCGC